MFTTIDQIRAQFPALEQKVYGKSLVYLDNAATTQKPLGVLEQLRLMEGGMNGNIHRAVHYLSARCTEQYEQARHTVQEYLNARLGSEIIFTSGTTAAINMLAFSFGETYVKQGDAVLITQAEHHSNLVPWQMLCQRKQAQLWFTPVDETGHLDMQEMERQLAKGPKLLAFTHVSNVLGLVNPIKEVVALAHRYGVPVLVDGAQGVVHGKVDVQDTDVDFYVFSGHKLYGPTGTGVLYGKEHYLEEMVPWQGGGDMIASVSLTKGTSYAALPMKFEAGTANYIGAAALGKAVEFMESVDGQWFSDHENRLVTYGLEKLQQIEGLRLYGKPLSSATHEKPFDAGDKVPLFTFSVQGAHPNDMALLLDQMGVAVRSGQLCAEPLLERFGQSAVLRASFGVYNTLEEMDYLVDCLGKVVAMLR